MLKSLHADTSISGASKSGAPSGTTRGLMDGMDFHVQAIRNLLELNSIYTGDVDISDAVGQALSRSIAKTAEITAGEAESIRNSQQSLGGSGVVKPSVDLKIDEVVHWHKCLTILNLAGEQKAAIINLQDKYASLLLKIHEDRAVLKDQVGYQCQSTTI